ncbi:hypothetical protein T11_123 [Trichinella zimbabwensis]|uniref:Uncharacterized protein n=1 Tax=Trichinella zimbabwensis TaxID=268475 RepID=A0A0V1H779_9BILA|nr:hypothetical protein T11_123 [Trichinella zimbabwensis]
MQDDVLCSSWKSCMQAVVARRLGKDVMNNCRLAEGVTVRSGGLFSCGITVEREDVEDVEDVEEEEEEQETAVTTIMTTTTVMRVW